MKLYKIATLFLVSLASLPANADPDCSEESIKEASSSSYGFYVASYCEAQKIKFERIEYMYSALEGSKRIVKEIEDEYEHTGVCNPEQDMIRLIQLDEALRRMARAECKLENNYWWPGDKTMAPILRDCLDYSPVKSFRKLKDMHRSYGSPCHPKGDKWPGLDYDFSPSFDCAGEVNALEMLICSDRTLSILDGYMSVIYGYVTSPRAGFPRKELANIREQQRDWLSRRGRAASDCDDCALRVRAEYEDRIEELERVLSIAFSD